VTTFKKDLILNLDIANTVFSLPVSSIYCDMTPETRNSEVRIDVHC
jgi:hypothetical protein